MSLIDVYYSYGAEFPNLPKILHIDISFLKTLNTIHFIIKYS